MPLEELSKSFEPWREKHARRAWVPRACEPTTSATSWFGGTPTVSSSADWPACRQCDKPMRFFLQLDSKTLPDGSEFNLGPGLLQLYYCSSDDGMCETWEAFSGTHSIRFVASGVPIAPPIDLDHLPRVDISGWDSVVDYPHPEEHEELGVIYHYDFDADFVVVDCRELDLAVRTEQTDGAAEAVALSRTGDKLGGWPYWVQGPEYPNCPQCGQRMRLLMQIDSSDNIDYQFGDCGCAHLTYCPNHKEIFAFGWACG